MISYVKDRLGIASGYPEFDELEEVVIATQHPYPIYH